MSQEFKIIGITTRTEKHIASAMNLMDACVLCQNLNYPSRFRGSLHVVEEPDGTRLSMADQRKFILGREPTLTESWNYEPIVKVAV